MANKYCDYGHEATKARRLNLGGGAGIFLCKTHWDREMRYRKERNKQLTGDARFPIRKFPS